LSNQACGSIFDRGCSSSYGPYLSKPETKALAHVKWKWLKIW